MYIAYETSPTNRGTYYLPAIGGTMSDRPVLRQKGDILTIGDNREVYSGEYADELYTDILAALERGSQTVFDIPAYIAKKEAAEGKKAAAAAKKAEPPPEAAAEEPPTEEPAKSTSKTTKTSGRTTKTTGKPADAEGSGS